ADLCSCNLALTNFNVRGGRFPKDRSRIGCYDMAGNVAEWCDDWYDANQNSRTVCGGSFDDEKPDLFTVTSKRSMATGKSKRWIGFRGVVRITVDKVMP